MHILTYKKALSKLPCATGHWVYGATCETREGRGERKITLVDALLFALFDSTHKHTHTTNDKFP